MEEGVGAQRLGVIGIGVASEELIDLLGEQGLGRVGDVLAGARVGQEGGQASEHAQAAVEGADSEQAGVRDDLWAVESEQYRLRVSALQDNLRGNSSDHELEPPYVSKWKR